MLGELQKRIVWVHPHEVREEKIWDDYDPYIPLSVVDEAWREFPKANDIKYKHYPHPDHPHVDVYWLSSDREEWFVKWFGEEKCNLCDTSKFNGLIICETCDVPYLKKKNRKGEEKTE